MRNREHVLRSAFERQQLVTNSTLPFPDHSHLIPIPNPCQARLGAYHF